MSAVVVSIMVVLALYGVAMYLLPRRGSGGEFAQKILERVENETRAEMTDAAKEIVLRQQSAELPPGLVAFLELPMMRHLHALILRAGFSHQVPQVLMSALTAAVVLSLVLAGMASMGLVGILLAVALSYAGLYWYLNKRIRKRNETLIDMCPDALDMIVRSLRSGFPLNVALRMVADNSIDPLKSEFQQLVDEVAMGRTLTEALQRMGNRIDEPDINFFVVVLTVQQETGGNLAEVISNLSSIIRKRKQLRQKIKAMTSEGRATGYVLGAMPIVVMGVLQLTSPNHLTPLFTTSTGHIVLGTAIALIVLAGWIVKQLIDIEV